MWLYTKNAQRAHDEQNIIEPIKTAETEPVTANPFIEPASRPIEPAEPFKMPEITAEKRDMLEMMDREGWWE